MDQLIAPAREYLLIADEMDRGGSVSIVGEKTRVTSTGDIRVTSTGDTRVIEYALTVLTIILHTTDRSYLLIA